MPDSSSPVYCPLIQQLVNNTKDPSNTTSMARLEALSLGLVVLHGLVSFLGILENLLILGVIGLRVRHTVISMWILNLAASDLLATASLPFFTLYMARGGTWTMGTTFCRLHSSVFFLNMFVSGLLLGAISLDRCLVVMRPVWTQNHRNIRLVGRVCGVIWALAVLCTVPFYVFRDTIRQRDGRIMCYYNYARYLPEGDVDLAVLCRTRQEVLAVVKLLLSFLLPLVVIIGSYIMVTYKVARRGHLRSLRFVRLVVAVVVSFVACWAPYHILIVLEAVAPRGSQLQKVAAKALPTAASFTFLNSVLNPVLYVFSCPDLCTKIRQSLRVVLENVLVEDLEEFSWRRSTAQSIISTSELLVRDKHSTHTNFDMKEVGGGAGERVRGGGEHPSC